MNSSSERELSPVARLLQFQIVRFCLVGASSTIISQGILGVLAHSFGPQLWTIWSIIGFIFGVSNGFFWNRRWTFEQGGQKGGEKQFAKFVTTNLIGLALNLFITKGFLILFLGSARQPRAGEETIVQIASLCAIPIVVIWNFSASRFWTFRKPKPESKGAEPESGAQWPPISEANSGGNS